MPPPPKKPTMRDVSRLAGVSTMTVSRVLADPAIVSEETRLRVLTAVEQLGYVPDLVAGSLSSRRTNFVGLILPTLTNSNFGDTAQGLAEALGPSFQLLIGYTLYRLAEEERLVRALLSRRPEALVVAGSIHTVATRRMLTNAAIPVVEIWERPEPPIGHAIGFSNVEAGRAAARHLIDLGHRRIAALGSVVGEDVADHRGEGRLLGFASALRDAGIGDDLVLRLGSAPVSFEHGANAMGHLLQTAPDVEAVFAVSDVSAFGAMMECRRRGIDVPGRIAVLGFGDFEIGRQCEPAISTVRVDAKAIGEETGRLLIELFENRGASQAPVSRDMGIDVVVRHTTVKTAASESSPRDGANAGHV